MTGYLILIGFFLFIFFILWLRHPIKKTMVYPVDPITRKLRDGLMSEKRRIKVIKEEHGIAIGFWLAVGVMILGWWCSGLGGS